MFYQVRFLNQNGDRQLVIIPAENQAEASILFKAHFPMATVLSFKAYKRLGCIGTPKDFYVPFYCG